MELKLNHAVMSLYVGTAIQIAAAAFFNLKLAALENNSPDSSVPMLAIGMTFPIALVVASVFVVKGLKQKKGWAWIGALALSLTMLAGWSFPAALYAGLCLLDRRVRQEFIDQLDISF